MKTPEEYLQEQVVLPENRAGSSLDSLEQEFIRRYVDPQQELQQIDSREQEVPSAQGPEDAQEEAASRIDNGPAEEEECPAPQPGAEVVEDTARETSSALESQEGPVPETGSVQLVGFSLKGQEYTLPITEVHEVIRKTEPTRLPTAPEYIVGVINLRGKITPVVDLGLLLGKDTDLTECQFVVVCRHRDLQIGLLVERITTMHNVTSDQVEWSVEAHLGSENLYLAGLIKYEGNLTGIIALEKLVQAVINTE